MVFGNWQAPRSCSDLPRGTLPWRFPGLDHSLHCEPVRMDSRFLFRLCAALLGRLGLRGRRQWHSGNQYPTETGSPYQLRWSHRSTTDFHGWITWRNRAWSDVARWNWTRARINRRTRGHAHWRGRPDNRRVNWTSTGVSRRSRRHAHRGIDRASADCRRDRNALPIAGIDRDRGLRPYYGRLSRRNDGSATNDGGRLRPHYRRLSGRIVDRRRNRSRRRPDAGRLCWWNDRATSDMTVEWRNQCIKWARHALLKFLSRFWFWGNRGL